MGVTVLRFMSIPCPCPVPGQYQQQPWTGQAHCANKSSFIILGNILGRVQMKKYEKITKLFYWFCRFGNIKGF